MDKTGVGKHAYLTRLGVTHVPLMVNETDRSCVERREAELLTKLSATSSGVAEHWRDCDVVVEWERILRAIAPAELQ